MERTPDNVIDSTKYRAGIKTNKQLAERIGLIPQTLSHKRKYPSTFTGGDIATLSKLLSWSDEEIATFIRGILKCREQ